MVSLGVQSSRKSSDTHWVCQYEAMVAACCRGLGLDADQVEEATAETLLAALKGASTFAGRASRTTWLWRIAYFQAVNVLRRQGRDQNRVPLHEEYYEYRQPEPWQQLVQIERADCVSEALQQLPTPWATAIRQYYWQCKSTQEIANTMQVTSRAVRVYLYRGRSRLRDLLGEDFVSV